MLDNCHDKSGECQIKVMTKLTLCEVSDWSHDKKCYMSDWSHEKSVTRQIEVMQAPDWSLASTRFKSVSNNFWIKLKHWIISNSNLILAETATYRKEVWCSYHPLIQWQSWSYVQCEPHSLPQAQWKGSLWSKSRYPLSDPRNILDQQHQSIQKDKGIFIVLIAIVFSH